MVRKKDKFWEYVEPISVRRFKCKFCEREFFGGITRVKSHLSGIVGREIEICSKVPEEVQAEAYLAVHGSNKKGKQDPRSSNQEQAQTIPGCSSTGMPQSTISGICKKKDKEFVDKLLCQHIISNNIAFNVLQTQSLDRFVKAVAEYGPSYKLPSYSTLRTKLVPNARVDVEEYVALVQKSWVKSGCSLMSDIWSDLKQRAFINLIAYSPGGTGFMNSFEVSKERKTGLYLKQIVSFVIEAIGAEHVVQFITDNATNFESAGDMLIGQYPRLYKTRCAAHGVQLLLKDIYEQVGWIRRIFDAAKSIVIYMYRHSVVLALMRDYTKRELKSPCVTRFASNYQMLQSIFVVQNELRSLVASAEWRGIKYNKAEKAIEVTEIIQSTEFWNEGKEILDALEPIIRVLRLVDGEGSTSAYIYEAMELAKKAIKQRCASNQVRYAKIWALFKERRANNILHPIHAAAAFLNPAYMCSENFKENREMKDGINFMLRNIVADNEKETFIKELQLYRMKVSTLFTDMATTMIKTSHPRVWWDYCGDSLPVLQKHAIRILSQPCSSSPCERNWSAFEAAQTKKRNRLAHKMLDTLVYVRMNTMMMEKFNSMEAKDLDPINPDKLSELPDYVDQEGDLENGSESLENGLESLDNDFELDDEGSNHDAASEQLDLSWLD